MLSSSLDLCSLQNDPNVMPGCNIFTVVGGFYAPAWAVACGGVVRVGVRLFCGVMMALLGGSGFRGDFARWGFREGSAWQEAGASRRGSSSWDEVDWQWGFPVGRIHGYSITG